MTNSFKRLLIFFLYCLPAFIGLSLVLGDYHNRTDRVEKYIEQYQKLVETAVGDEIKKSALAPDKQELPSKDDIYNNEKIAEVLKADMEQAKQLIAFFTGQITGFHRDQKGQLIIDTHDDIRIDRELDEIWFRNSIFISVLALLPFVLLGTRLATSRKLPLSLNERISASNKNWWMKFLFACVLTIGWVYTLNPQGRAASTVAQFIIAVDLSQIETLPMYIKSQGITPVVAGFLGWFLHLMTYFFNKLIRDDVVSHRVYSFLFKKFLFIYGVALILPPIQSDSEYQQVSLFVFFLGYFPLSAVSMLRETTMKTFQGFQSEKGQLTELPGISRWQILRLEEEGIDCMASLANANQEELKRNLPWMYSLACYWIDIAQLYVILGQTKYQKVKVQCLTASEFIANADKDTFIENINNKDIGDVKEIARLLQRTFSEKLIKIKP